MSCSGSETEKFTAVCQSSGIHTTHWQKPVVLVIFERLVSADFACLGHH